VAGFFVTNFLLIVPFQIKSSIMKYLRQTLNASNCLLCRKLGQIYTDDGGAGNGLYEASTAFFRRNFEDVSRSEHFATCLTIDELIDFFSMSAATSPESTEAIGAGTIFVKSEDAILEAIIAWVNFDVPIRKQHLGSLANFLLWKNVSEKCLAQFKMKFPNQLGKLGIYPRARRGFSF
jgi:hypothetical protein